MKAIAYYRTSSATNIGEDKDSRKRQCDAVTGYANQQNTTVVAEFYDEAIRGTDPVTARPGFIDLLAYAEQHNIQTILVENASRFARDVVVQITGYEMLKRKNITIIPADCPWHFTEDTPTAKLIRTVLGAVAEFEKDALVDKMRKARDRKRRETGRCEGRKLPSPECIAAALSLRAQGHTLRGIGPLMAELGFINKGDKRPYSHESVRRMVREYDVRIHHN